VFEVKDRIKELVNRDRRQIQYSAVTTIAHAIMEIAPCSQSKNITTKSQIDVGTLHERCDSDDESGSGFCGGYLVGTGDALYKYAARYPEKRSCYREYSAAHKELDRTLSCFIVYSTAAGQLGSGSDEATRGVASCLAATVPCD
jgi:hypothetical protein